MVREKSLMIIIFVFTLMVAMIITAELKADIKVYDANNQYLGILVDTDEHAQVTRILVPALGIVVPIAIDEDETTYLGNIQYVYPLTLYYETGDCSGTPYFSGVVYKMVLNHEIVDELIYLDVDNAKGFIPGSLAGIGPVPCTQINEDDYHYVQKVFVPLKKFEAEFPFTLPVALPLRFEHSESSNTQGDINGDGKIGLEEAVHALKVVSDVEK